MAVPIGIAVWCEPCNHTDVAKCPNTGAISKVAMDAAGVAVIVGGGPVYTCAPIVAAALEHFGSGIAIGAGD